MLYCIYSTNKIIIIESFLLNPTVKYMQQIVYYRNVRIPGVLNTNIVILTKKIKNCNIYITVVFMEACFRHWLKIKKAIVTFYLTIQIFFSSKCEL